MAVSELLRKDQKSDPPIDARYSALRRADAREGDAPSGRSCLRPLFNCDYRGVVEPNIAEVSTYMSKMPQPLPETPTLSYELHGNCYLNITWHCTLRCDFCPKFNGTWDVQDYDLRLRQEPSASEVLAAIGDPAPYHEIVFCGLGEPTLRLDTLLEVAVAMKHQGKRVRVNTDGLANLVYGRDVTPELAAVVDAVSISMNAQDEATYVRHTRPKLAGAFDAMLDFARLARKRGLAVTLTAIDGLEGVDIPSCQHIADELGVPFRRRVLDVVG